ncbi:MFS transporter [Pseudoxanthobacter sp.]|uniref:MFS transporter n=1 Tax=Pseudoxanthobacter sp. TaxID=1925742 RepID=UPI002FE42259
MIVEGRETGFAGPVTWRSWLVWGTAALFYLYEFFVRVAPSSMEPELQAHFGLSAAALGAAAGTYYMIYSPMQLLSGTVIDRFGPRNVLVLSALVCTAGAFLQIIGSSPGFLVAARFAQGMGSAFAFVGTMYVAAEWFPRSMLALLSGLTTSLGMAGAIIGNAGIAEIVETMGWQQALLFAGFIGIAITLLIAVIVPARRPEPAAAGHPEPHIAPSRPGVIRALRVVYSNPQSWYLGLVGATLYMPLSILGALWGAEYISAVTGGTKLEATSAISMMYVGWLVGGPVAGWVSDRFGIRRRMLMVASAATLGVTLFIALVPELSLPATYGVMLLLGLASTSQVVVFAAAVEHNPGPVTGTAIAATNMIIMLLGGAGEWAFGELLDLFGDAPADTVSYPQAAYHYAILLLPVLSAIGFAASLLLREASEAEHIHALPAAEA